MRMKMLAVAMLLTAAALSLAAQKLEPLHVKPGLWEVTTNTARTGQMPISPELLAKLTPEQRARMEERMKAQGENATRARVRKSCVTKEKLEKSNMFEERQSCKRTVVTSTGSKMEVRAECDSPRGTKINVSTVVEALDSENIKGSMQMSASGGENAMNMNTTFTGKWLGATCGDVE
jgi:hypothetical protein